MPFSKLLLFSLACYWIGLSPLGPTTSALILLQKFVREINKGDWAIKARQIYRKRSPSVEIREYSHRDRSSGMAPIYAYSKSSYPLYMRRHRSGARPTGTETLDVTGRWPHSALSNSTATGTNVTRQWLQASLYGHRGPSLRKNSPVCLFFRKKK